MHDDVKMTDQRAKTCCFTGHRLIAAADRPLLRPRLREEILLCYGRGVRNFGTGGALGFDMLAAEEVLSLRESECPDARLILVLPCRNQADRWSAADREHYAAILAAADKVVYTSDAYFNGCMQKRNRHLVDCSGHCIAYLTHDFGGTAYTVRYAMESGLSVSIIP